MIGFLVQTQSEMQRVKKASDEGAFRSFSRAAFAIRTTAVQSIEKAEGPSEPGEPPHTHEQKLLRRAIRYEANKEGAVIGPRFSIVGTAGEAHEFGGEFKGTMFPERPTMVPALEANLDRFANEWSGSISS